MDLLIHCGVGHESKHRIRNLRKAILGRVLKEALEELNIFFVLEHLIALIHYFVEIIFWLLSDQSIEVRPTILVNQILANIPENVKAVKEMNSIELSVFLERLQGWDCGFVLICDDNIGHFVHDLGKGLEDLVESLLRLFVANDKTKRHNLFWRTDPHECPNSVRLLPVLYFLDEVEREVKAHPISEFPKIFLHEWSHHNHQVRQLIHFKVVRVAMNVIFLFI